MQEKGVFCHVGKLRKPSLPKKTVFYASPYGVKIKEKFHFGIFSFKSRKFYNVLYLNVDFFFPFLLDRPFVDWENDWSPHLHCPGPSRVFASFSAQRNINLFWNKYCGEKLNKYETLKKQCETCRVIICSFLGLRIVVPGRPARVHLQQENLHQHRSEISFQAQFVFPKKSFEKIGVEGIVSKIIVLRIVFKRKKVLRE